jgi:hypothetical protein
MSGGDPAAELQLAVRRALIGNAVVAALVGDRVYDLVPVPSTFPYITIFDIQTIDDSAECIEGSECYLDIHVWSRAAGSVEAKNIASAVRATLHEEDLSLGADHDLFEIRFRDQQVVRDPDGLTTHAIMHFRALTEAAL